ncbi:MAG TPA: peptide chain release factor N(5)-glutamine methyltransferase [Acidobacteriota bacterium]|nr:peptide chain release factor N(5)-glutamine methyltransferase [Acidobacteriota bacterium]
MDTIGAARTWAIHVLEQAGVEPATLTADLLLAFVLGWDRVQVLTRAETQLQPESHARFTELIARRSKGEPLQYLTGEQEFYGLKFRVTPEVLIPRPETEILVEKAIDLAGEVRGRPVRFVDVGTGSGCISVAVAQALPGSLSCAIDISMPALTIARENAQRHGVLGRIQFLCCDLLGGVASEPSFDMILSNPPYVADTEYNSLPVMVRDHEPHPALFAGRRGTDVQRRLIPQVGSRLHAGGYLLMEIGLGQPDTVTQLIRQGGLSLEGILDDLQGIPRCVVARKIG